MGTLIRWLTLAVVLYFAYQALTSEAAQAQPGLRGLLQKIRLIGRKMRLVAMIYIAVLVVSAALRIMGWGLD